MLGLIATDAHVQAREEDRWDAGPRYCRNTDDSRKRFRRRLPHGLLYKPDSSGNTPQAARAFEAFGERGNHVVFSRASRAGVGAHLSVLGG